MWEVVQIIQRRSCASRKEVSTRGMVTLVMTVDSQMLMEFKCADYGMRLFHTWLHVLCNWSPMSIRINHWISLQLG